MNKEQILGIIRHIFTFVGGIVMMKGWLDETTFMELSGALITIIGSIWSVLSKPKVEAPKE